MKLVITILVLYAVQVTLAQDLQSLDQNPSVQQDGDAFSGILGEIVKSLLSDDPSDEITSPGVETIDKQDGALQNDDPISYYETLNNLETSDFDQPEHIRERRGLRKLKNKFGGLKRKVNKVLGPPGSSRRKAITAVGTKIFGK